MYADGNLETSLRKIRLFVVIAKPNFGCSTQTIYEGIKKYSKKRLTKGNKNYFSLINIIKLQNDLEKVVFKNYPKLKNAKLFMQNLPNVSFVRMTGSGSSIVGYFLLKNEAINAVKLFKKKI